MICKTGTKPAGTSGSYTPIKNVSFVAREYWGCDDELTERELFEDFGGDNYVVSGNFLYLGITRSEDGCEPLTEESPEEYDECIHDGMDEDEGDGEDKVRVAEAVRHALRLQKFFRRQRKQEQKATEGHLVAEVDRSLGTEPDVVEKTVRVKRGSSSCGHNRKAAKQQVLGKVRVRRVRQERTWSSKRGWFYRAIAYLSTETATIGYYWAQAQHCHGATDNRRYRRGDTTGKMIGCNHRRRDRGCGSDQVMLRPVAVDLHTLDGTIRRISIS